MRHYMVTLYSAQYYMPKSVRLSLGLTQSQAKRLWSELWRNCIRQTSVVYSHRHDFQLTVIREDQPAYQDVTFLSEWLKRPSRFYKIPRSTPEQRRLCLSCKAWMKKYT